MRFNPQKLTVGKLRKAMEGLADDTPVVIDNESHKYQPAGDASATTALVRDVDEDWTEDFIYPPGQVGEKTEFGERVAVLRINDL